MTVDDTSSADASLIDDDLVEALGFEPVTTVDVDVDDESGAASGADSAQAAVSNGSANGRAVETTTLDSENALSDDALSDDVASESSALDEAMSLKNGLVGEVAGTVEIDDEWDDAIVLRDDPDRQDDQDLSAPTEAVETIIDLDQVAGADELESDAEAETADPVDASTVDASTVDASTVDLSAPESDTDSLESEFDALDPTPMNEVEVEMPLGLADPDDVFAAPVGDVGHTQLLDRTDGADDASLATSEAVPAPAVTQSSRRSTKKRLRARKSRRVIKHIDPWSVLTFSVLFHMCVFGALLLSSVLVWNAATASGTVENVESFIQELGDYETFEINADVMFRAAVAIAGMLTLASSVLVVLLTVVFNLISDLIGGIRVTVIEEETVRVPLTKAPK